MASTTAELLRKKGLNVVEETNADDLHEYSEIRYGGQKPETIKRLCALLKIPVSRAYNQNIDASNNADVVVILGADWANNN